MSFQPKQNSLTNKDNLLPLMPNVTVK